VPWARRGARRRPPPRLPGHPLGVVAGRGAEDRPALSPLGCPDGALTGPSRPLLFPGLASAPGDLAAALGVVGAGAEGRQLPRDRLMQQRDPYLDAEDLGLELEGFLRLSGLVENGNLGHAYSAFRCRCV